MDERLHRKLDSAIACEQDFYRQHHEHDGLIEKAPFAWDENGTFSGGDDEDALQSFEIEKSRSAANGFIHVPVRLKWGDTPDTEKPWFSRVIVVVGQEKGNLVVDDLIYRGGKEAPRNERLSKILSYGCRTGHWIGPK